MPESPSVHRITLSGSGERIGIRSVRAAVSACSVSRIAACRLHHAQIDSGGSGGLRMQRQLIGRDAAIGDQRDLAPVDGDRFFGRDFVRLPFTVVLMTRRNTVTPRAVRRVHGFTERLMGTVTLSLYQR